MFPLLALTLGETIFTAVVTAVATTVAVRATNDAYDSVTKDEEDENNEN